MRFIVNKGIAEKAPLFPEPSLSAQKLGDLVPDSTVESDGAVGEVAVFTKIKFKETDADHKGWVETRVLTQGDRSFRCEVIEESFVRSCVHTELKGNVGENSGPFPVVADYLLAWSLIETNMKNQAPDASNDGASGPFAITDTDWQRYVTAAGLSPRDGESDRDLPDLHNNAAAFLARDQMEAFSKLQLPPGATIPVDGPHIPTYLNVLHSQFFGVAAADALNKDFAKGGSSKVSSILEAVIPDQAIRTKLTARRSKFLTAEQTVKNLFETMAKLLDEKLVEADKLIRKNFPEVIPDVASLSGGAPWFDIAKTEFAFWDTNLLDASKQLGKQRVIEYFSAVNPDIRSVEPWCGAFVGHCLSKAGDAARETIVRQGEWAANWKNWGNTELRLAPGTKIPQGAVVATVPLAEGASGHVGFFDKELDATRISILGGNQSGRVRFMPIERNKIVSIRWMDLAPDIADVIVPSPGGGPQAAATDRDVLTLARTLYGEARGEKLEGIEAVASVVMNRFAAAGGRLSVSGVCLKPYQFSCWNRNDPNRKKIKDKVQGSDPIFNSCFAVAEQAVKGLLTQRVGKARHYHARYIAAPRWARGVRPIARIGVHLFYENIP